MTREITLTYRGESSIDPSANDKAHTIVDQLLSVAQDSALTFGTGTVYVENGRVHFRFNLEQTVALANAPAAIETLGENLVDLGVEPDLSTAKENITQS
jgi:hypothetical protein